MKRLIIISVIACLSCTLFVSCDKISEKKNSDSTNTKKFDISTSDYINLSLKNDTFIPLKETVQKHIYFDEISAYKLDKSIDEQIISSYWVDDKIIIESFNENDTDCIELGVLDPYNNNYSKKMDIPFTAAYKNNVEIISDRYYITAHSYQENDSLIGKIILYDIESGKLSTIDEFSTYNIVQYLCVVGKSGIAYLYYEAETADWIVKYYDLIKGESREVFRHSNNNDILMSPVSLGYDEGNIILAVQLINEEPNVTKFVSIDFEADSYTVEDTDLYNFFGENKFEITDLHINDDIYYIQANVNDSYEYYLFDRSENELCVILPAVFHLKEIIGGSGDDIVSFWGTNSSSSQKHIFNIDTENNTIENYSVFDSTSEMIINTVGVNNKGDLFVLCGDNVSGFYYYIINDYKLQAKQKDTALFMYPEDQIKLAEKNYPEKLDEIKKMQNESLHTICENDFRWKYAYSEN